MKSLRNKTIDISVEDGAAYLERCIAPPAPETLPEEMPCGTVNGDCFEVMRRLPKGFADLAIADPPYNLTKTYATSVFSKRSEEEYLDYTRRWLDALLPLLKRDASVYVCCDWRCSAAVSRALGERLTVRNRITWQREKGRGANRNWKNSMEDIWFATVSDDYCFNLDAVKVRRRVIAPYRENGEPKDWEQTERGRFRDTCPSNFWDDITVPYWSMPENTAHPAQKPEKLLAKLILASSEAGDMVFDPFLGSGSTSVAAKKLGRRWLGIEREKQFCVWAEKRLADADNDRRIQGFSDGIFLPRNPKSEI